MADSWDWNTQKDEGIQENRAGEQKKGLVSIVIPAYLYDYSLFHYTGNCIGSIREHTKPGDYEIIIIDNGSTIKHKEMADWKADKVIRNEKNMGVAYAWNQGIRVSQGEYICLLNNDTMVFDNWMEDFKALLNAGLIDFAMSSPMYGDAFARSIESQAKRQEALTGGQRESLVDSRDFACVMCKKALFDEIGLFN